MAKPNTSFDISVEDLDLIETALRQATPKATDPYAPCPKAETKARQIQELLGRLHNQKRFYRPSNKVVLGG